MDVHLREQVKEYLKRELVPLLSRRVSDGYALKDFQVNPFGLIALASGVLGTLSPENIAKSLIYPRILGTSFTTTFGDLIQKMCVQLLGAQASAAPGLDIEYEDRRPGHGGRIVSQLKAGPNTINSGDVEPILEKMRSACRLLRQNRVGERMPTFSVGVLYGHPSELSGHYRRIAASNVMGQESVPVLVGEEFWHGISGDSEFYASLISIFVEIFQKENHSNLLEEAVSVLAREIEEEFFTLGEFDPFKAGIDRYGN